MLWFLPALFLTELIFMLMRLVLKPSLGAAPGLHHHLYLFASLHA